MSFKPLTDLKIPKFTAGRPGRKSNQELARLASKRGPVAEQEKQRIAEFRARLLSTTGHRVIDAMIKVAMDPDHPQQVSMLKFIGDRILPLDQFTAESTKERGAPVVNIVLNSGPMVKEVPQSIDAEFTEVSDGD